MDKHYNHAENERAVYQRWLDSDAFTPKAEGEPFTIIMPPPNANDPLHIGHAMFATIEDVIIRYQRMKGKAALWLPGTDHAGIETQFVFEKKLAKEGKSRFQYDRETLYQMIWDYVQQNSDVAVEQLKRIGVSADWSRFTFMLEPKIVTQVLETFGQLNIDGLIYRDKRMVNYCTKCGTSFSELEVLHEERESSLYRVRYFLVDSPDEYIDVDTTRPETIFADVAIAIHPTHPMAKAWAGKMVQNPISTEDGKPIYNQIKVIVDEAVDPTFGTGAVKITPEHDPLDEQIWLRHKDKLPTPWSVIGFDGKMSNSTLPSVRGKKVLAAREVVISQLLGDRLIGVKKHIHSVGVCYRCKTVIEPLRLTQFFVKVKPLVDRVLKGLDAGEVEIIGAGHDKILRHWLENLKDWNISRQIVWGIRMPVWYDISNNQNNNIEVVFVDKTGQRQQGQIGHLLEIYTLDEIRAGLTGMQVPSNASFVVSTECPGDTFIQETDTFDTWFSSAQWPYTTLLKNGKDEFERFYPTQVMETGYDILPFWVMRMLMMGYYKSEKLWGKGKEKPPFTQVYLHGLVRDEKGQKMSKSKGNVINPLDVIEKYGADALRMALVMSTSAGKDSNTGETKIRGMRNLSNKIWNAARFLMLREIDEPSNSGEGDEIFWRTLEKVRSEVTGHLEALRIGLAAEVVYGEFWHWFCDVAIENGKQGKISLAALRKGMEVFLHLFHPFVPFVTEAVHAQLYSVNKTDSPTLLLTSQWPGELESLANRKSAVEA